MNPAISSFVPPAMSSVAPQMPAQGAPSSQQQGFAQALSEAQATKNDAAATDAAATDAAPEAGPAKPGKPCQPAERARSDKAARAEKTTKGDNLRSPEKAEGEATESVDKAETEPAADAPPCADPALADWLAALQRPAAPQTAEPGKTAAAGSDDATADTALTQKGGSLMAAGGPLAAAKHAPQDAAELAHGAKASDKAERVLPDATGSSSFQAAMAQAEEGRPEINKPAHDTQPVYGAVTAGLQPTHSNLRSSEAAAPVAVQMPTPATSPEFSQSLGVQVSVLAKDGIQQAELHLNPAEMGPISVQIAIDGTQAQVNFGADSAATRQIIESGLPELAASLREAGFTLAGGGVHSQARGSEQGGDGARGDRGDRSGAARAIGSAAETDVTARRAVSRVSAGGVDLYA